jgi:predicted P-loop ATPase
MMNVMRGFREVLNNSTYLAELKEQNGLLRQQLQKQKTDKESKYRDRQMAYLRPQYEMKDYVRATWEMCHNVVTDVYEYRRKAEGTWKIIDKRELNSIANEVADAGIFCLDSQVKRFVESEFAKDYHPVTAYLNSVRGKWDGERDYADDLLRRVSADPYFLRLGRIWLRGVVAQWLHWDPMHANAVMLLIVSPQQGLHKSTCLRELLPRTLRDYYTDDFSLSTKGNAQRKMVEFALINMDEFDKEPRKKMPELKSLMQTLKPSFIGAYKKNFNRLPRIASFVGTSNCRELLTDPTGSRRFLVVEPEGLINVEGICHDQLYAQLLQEVEGGEPCFFSKDDERQMEEHNRPYRVLSPVEKLVGTFFRQPEEGEDCWSRSAADIIKELASHNHALMRSMSQSEMGKVMKRLGWKSEHTEYGNVYRVVKK